MKLDNAIALGKAGAWKEAQVRVSPGNIDQWFVMLHDKDNKAYVFADNEDKPITHKDLNALAPLIKSLGLNDFTVFL
ncbi:Uncharacterised protein [Zhongshania aliphaticivorans]|uniref:Uncharacterized protein n=1 Tax=Zhongshania aliphaticivorans TaxID=1470434 RepID=A0A5S9QAH2_9GAMM|nr:hypothetical protein [Zhongshania aliphaticivorans]CAA0102309.1 Uncharacterised protein [Zhongshania aliphaticivorans]CAA0114406.1 Uncharacterised protein [Zhongshania aliphaticivorans]